MFVYLAAMQMLPLYIVSRYYLSGEQCNWQRIIIWQTALILLFWIVWGGVSNDGAEYLFQFNNPGTRPVDPFFYKSGYFLGQVFPDPWPLRIFSLIIAALGLGCYYIWFRHKEAAYRETATAVLLMMYIPGIYLLTANVVRQGLATTIIIAAAIFLDRKKWFWAIAACILALAIHYSSFILVLCCLVAIILPLPVLRLAVLAPLLGLAVPHLSSMLGIEISQYVKYSNFSEGMFHYAKLIAYGGIALILLFLMKPGPIFKLDMHRVYIVIVAVASLFVSYEVPFERILIYSDYILPLCIVPILDKISIRGGPWAFFAILSISMFGTILWFVPSIAVSMGYG
jgi:hypothetical protein